MTWDIALIRLTSEAMEAELEGGYPLLAYVFYGDYEGAVGLMRELAPEEIYTAASSLIIGTVAEGWTEGLGQNLVDSADSAIAARPDLAAAYLTRSWGAYLLDPASAQARADAARAAELAPGDDFYAACAAYVETAPTTAGYVPAPVYLAEGIQAAVQDALGAAGVLSEEPFIDPLTGLGGTGRQVTISGTGVDFASFVAVADTLRQVLEAQGWAEDVSYQADGPTGTAFGYRLDAALALVNVGWEPAPGADCPEDQPISDCDLAPEERLYTITLNIAEQ